MPFDPELLTQRFRRLAPAADYCSLRVVEERSESISVRQDRLLGRVFGSLLTTFACLNWISKCAKSKFETKCFVGGLKNRAAGNYDCRLP